MMNKKLTKVPQVKSKLSKVSKHTKLNNSNFVNFTLNDYRVFMHLISKIKRMNQEDSSLLREHKLTASEFSEMFNTSLSHCYGILKDAVDKLMKTDIKIYKPELNEKWRINVCSSAEYNETKGSITIKFTDDIMPYLLHNKQQFVLYHLKEIANFGSIYTTRLYELVQEYKTTRWFVRSVDALREIFAVGDKLETYKDFKKYTFAHACDEINKNYDMGLSFEEGKEGRKVVAIKFTFKKTI